MFILENNRQNELDDLRKYEKKELMEETFIIDYMTESYIGENGFFKLCFLKVDSDEVNGFMFISSNSALDKPGIIGIPVTLTERISKNKYTYYKYREPDLTYAQMTLDEPKPERKINRKSDELKK